MSRNKDIQNNILKKLNEIISIKNNNYEQANTFK